MTVGHCPEQNFFFKIYFVLFFFLVKILTHLLDSHTAKIGIVSGWSKPLFTNIGIDTFGTLKIHTSWSKYSFNELHGIWVSCLLLVMSSGGTSLCGMKIGYLFRLHSGGSSGCFNIELIIPRIQSIRSMLHFTWLSEKVFNNNAFQ